MESVKGTVLKTGVRNDGIYYLMVSVPAKELFYGEVRYETIFINFGKKDITKNKEFKVGNELDIPKSMY